MSIQTTLFLRTRRRGRTLCRSVACVQDFISVACGASSHLHPSICTENMKAVVENAHQELEDSICLQTALD